MPDFLDGLIIKAINYCLEFSAKGWYEMTGMKGEPSGELLAGFLFQEDFRHKCKQTIVGYRDHRLEMIISSPGYKSATLEITDKIQYEGFEDIGTTQKVMTINHDKGGLSRLTLNPEDNPEQYFRLELVFDQKKYGQEK